MIWPPPPLPPPAPPLFPPPQPMAPYAKIASNRTNIEVHRRRRPGMPNSRTMARVAPPPPSQRNGLPDRCNSAVVLAAVVVTVSVELPFAPAARVTLVGFIPQVGTLCAPVGDEVRAQVRFIVPEYVLPTEKEIVELALPPGEIADGACPVATTGETVTVAVPLFERYVPSPEYCAVTVLLPALSQRVGTENVAIPLERVCCPLHTPAFRVTDPVGVGWPLAPLTATLTVTVWALVTVVALGVTDIVGTNVLALMV